MTLIEQAAAAIGLAWSPEDADRSTRAQPDSERLRRLSSRLRDTTSAAAYSEEDTVPGANEHRSLRHDQRMLWVDGVGGYLVTLADQIVLGQPAGIGSRSESGPSLPILADLSRQHANITRQAGGYVVTPHGPTWLDGRRLEMPATLSDGALLTLGDSVQIRFRQPHALSATARLELESPHRTVPGADAVLMMAESCVLGPKKHSHIRCRNWQGEAILFRGAEGLLCRADGGLLSDNVRSDGPVVVRPKTRIEGQDFTLSVEEVNEA
jgi:hypothetical protein